MEDLLYILLFVFIVGINLLIKNKNVLKKMFDSPYESERKYTKNLHKKVKKEQKLYRKQNEKYSDSVVSQSLPEVFAQNKKFEMSKFQKPQNIVQNSQIFFKGKTLREAIILKEILDLPVGLR